ncbi:MAG: cysteine--tRNA ligase [Proteobacteria bacterium]|jgi:cysteinyl-tRNA synthetase|nr:cysteine--tRNA ligase [Pseudomonadota bacterium]
MSKLHLYNTLTRKKEPFVPLDPERVTMYVCGPTVYSYAHIGNVRPPVVFDILARVLKGLYSQVEYVRNITDIDDKINNAALTEGVGIDVISARYIDAYHADLDALGVMRVDIEPRVTEHLPEILAMISKLIEEGHAYEAEAHVLFDVTTFDAYGELSGRSQDELLAGARVEIAAYKKTPSDFVLWKPSDDTQPGWDSPWGRGRPGWHIECSAMVKAHLGKTIDIHGGGADLVFPHHENEVAQSTCAHAGAPYARYWMHNGFINVNAEKMSKSLGNVLLVKDLVDDYPGEVIRYALLSAHYRAQLDWSDDTTQQAQSALDRLYGALRDADAVNETDSAVPQAFMNALLDDLNTPKALAEMFNMARALNASGDDAERAQLKSSLLACGQFLGILAQDPVAWFAGAAGSFDEEAINTLVADREKARADKDWVKADELRDQLLKLGIEIEDVTGGTRWRKARQ